jgi:hypothetical protein
VQWSVLNLQPSAPNPDQYKKTISDTLDPKPRTPKLKTPYPHPDTSTTRSANRPKNIERAIRRRPLPLMPPNPIAAPMPAWRRLASCCFVASADRKAWTGASGSCMAIAGFCNCWHPRTTVTCTAWLSTCWLRAPECNVAGSKLLKASAELLSYSKPERNNLNPAIA